MIITAKITIMFSQSIPSEPESAEITVTNISASVVKPSSFSIVQTTQYIPGEENGRFTSGPIPSTSLEDIPSLSESKSLSKSHL